MLSRSALIVVAMSFVLVAACGGTKKDTTTNRKVADDLDVPKGLSKTDPMATGPDGGVGALPSNDAGAGAAVTPDAGPITDPNAPFVTFRLKNSTSKDIELNLNQGWKLVVIAYTGVRFKGAISLEMFPRFCTAACSSAKADRCPYCKKPKGNKNEKDAQKRQVIPPGKTFDIPWDGTVHKYKKTRGKRGKRCSCFTTSNVKDNTYNVEAFGLHITTSAKKRSKLQRAKATMKTDGSTKQVVLLDFKPKTK